MIQQTTTANGPAFTTVYRGVEYYAAPSTIGDWVVTSNRLALGGSGFGTARRFADMAAIEAALKAFDGLTALTEATPV